MTNPGIVQSLRQRTIEFPDRVYKYKALVAPQITKGSGEDAVELDPNTIKLLKARELYFASPNQLNDPFDCRLEIIWEKMSVEGFRGTYAKMLASTPMAASDEYLKETIEAGEREFLDNPDRLKEPLQQALWKFAEANTSVLSLTRSAEHPLMWAHYASSHTGVCVGLDGRMLCEWLKNFDNEVGSAFPLEVLYTQDRIVLDPSLPDFRDNSVLSLISKGLDWQYEEELRVLWLDKGCHSRQAPDGIVKEVIFGARTTDAVVEIVRGLLDSNNIEFSKMHLSRIGFGLEKVEL